MTDRERFVRCVLGQPVDRPPFWLYWGPWATTWQRWQKEAMPAQLQSWGDVQRYFGADVGLQAINVNLGPCPKFEWKILEETDEWYIFIDSWGIKRRNLKHNESMSEFIEFPVKNRDDWKRFRDERLNPSSPDRLAGDWQIRAGEWVERGYPIQLGTFPDVGVFGTLRWLLGDEECLIAFCADPEWVHEIMDHLTSMWLSVFEQVLKRAQPDFIELWEDMCSKQGPLISPAHFDEFMRPCYLRVRAFADRHGIPVLGVDTDGDPSLIVPPMMRAGVNFMFPFEVAAGCDVNEYQKRHPGLAMMGGIDKRVLAQGKAEIDRELLRIAPAVRRGRYIPELDHLIPDDVSWDNFAYYAQQLRKLLEV